MSNLAPERLYLMRLNTLMIPTNPPALGSEGCYLIQTGDGKNILIDSGYPADHVAPADAPPAKREKNVLEQLADLDLHPDEIDFLICTHFDIDHAGYHDAFSHAECIVQRSHYEIARSGHPRFAKARSHWDHPSLRYRLIEGDFELLPGLTLIETSGHAPGHQSVLVQLPQTGKVLLTIDAVVLERLFTPERKAWPIEDEEQLRASTRKLLALVEREQVALVIFGHDGKQWEGLKRAPDYYA